MSQIRSETAVAADGAPTPEVRSRGAAADEPLRAEGSKPQGPARWLESLVGRRRRADPVPATVAPPPSTVVSAAEIDPDDPLLAYMQGAGGAVDLGQLELESPALRALRASGVVMTVPLVASGELIGLVNLGPRLSDTGYSTDDRHLLEALVGYAAPALRVGQLARQHASEAQRQERINQELHVAQLIQQQFLPKSLPDLPGWHLAAFYRPARTVGGDFYDFLELADGRVMLVLGDVTDKGIPAALVMASTHALLRAAAPELDSPGAVLERVNQLLCDDIPGHMFVTCLAMALDPRTGELQFANAGHVVPYASSGGGVAELRATGMPLGLMPDMSYEERSHRLEPGDCVLLNSDGVAETHNPARDMFGFPRVAALVAERQRGEALIDLCLTGLSRFAGPDYEQEDDITLVTLDRSLGAAHGEGSW